MTQTLAIGPFSDAEKEALTEAFGPVFVATPDDVARLADTIRAGVTSVAYKGHHGFGQAVMEQLPQLGIIANFGVGYDAIDVDAASARDIKVTTRLTC